MSKKKIEAIAQHDYISQTILLFEILTLVEDLQNCILLKMKSTFNIVKKLKKSLFWDVGLLAKNNWVFILKSVGKCEYLVKWCILYLCYDIILLKLCCRIQNSCFVQKISSNWKNSFGFRYIGNYIFYTDLVSVKEMIILEN